MSNFEQGRRPQGAPSDLFREIINRDPSLPLQEDELRFLNRVFGEWGPMPLGWRGGLKGWLATELPPEIPIFQLQGFAALKPNYANVFSPQGTNSATFTDLTTVGPELTGLSKGRYVLLFGALIISNGGVGARMGVKINATEAENSEVCYTPHTVNTQCTFALLKTLDSSSNTVTARYKTDNAANTATFDQRWLLAIRSGSV